MSGHVTRWVVTHINRDGYRTLTDASQGRHTYATREEAEQRARAITDNNSEARLASHFGPQAVGTFAARECECWPVHFDPKARYFDTPGGDA